MIIPPGVGIVIHPQSGSMCPAYRTPLLWPDEGFPASLEGPLFWPVPDLIEARLADCHCGKTVIYPLTTEAVLRYVPGAKLEEDGRIVLTLTSAMPPLPTGTGKDERKETSGCPGGSGSSSDGTSSSPSGSSWYTRPLL